MHLENKFTGGYENLKVPKIDTFKDKIPKDILNILMSDIPDNLSGFKDEVLFLLHEKYSQGLDHGSVKKNTLSAYLRLLKYHGIGNC